MVRGSWSSRRHSSFPPHRCFRPLASSPTLPPTPRRGPRGLIRRFETTLKSRFGAADTVGLVRAPGVPTAGEGQGSSGHNKASSWDRKSGFLGLIPKSRPPRNNTPPRTGRFASSLSSAGSLGTPAPLPPKPPGQLRKKWGWGWP